MNVPRVSCIVPVYNGERFLADGIGSVLSQTRPVDEIVIVDDGSTDATPEVVRSFGDRVTYVRQENAGPAAARNRGIHEATGDFISFLDADDLWEPTKLEVQLRAFADHPGLGYCVGLVQNFWEEEVAEERERMADSARARPIPGYVTLTLLTPREWMSRVGDFDESLGHGDAADWFRRADAAGAESVLIDKVVARRRLHRANRSRTKASDSRTEFLTMLKRKLDRERQGVVADPAPAAAGVRHPIEFRHPVQRGLVSCVVPVFNGERFLEEAVESILAQTDAPIEVIVVDDGSTDGTPDVIAKLGDRIRVVHQENRGPAAARNRGLVESRGEYIAFLDADDVWAEDKTELQLALMRAHPDVDICSGHIRSFWVPELDEERRRLEDEPRHRERAMLSPCTILTTRSVFQRVGGFDPDLRHGEDSDWFIRARQAGMVAETLEKLVTHRRLHPDNLTRAVPPSQDALMGLIQRHVEPEDDG